MSEKHKKVCRDVNFLEHFFIFVFAVSGFALISTFSTFVSVPVCITSSATGLKICAITP